MDTIWTEKYRPKTISDCVLPSSLKDIFNALVKKNDIPNMLLVGRPGLGKTTVAKALCNELGCDTMFLNGSKDGGIDILRNKIEVFASSVSLSGGKKVVIWDEGDNLTPATQSASRSFFEEYSKNCRFIITANYKQKIIEPMLSRLTVIEFNIPSDEKMKLASDITKRIFYILEQESIEYDKKSVGKVVLNYFPDFRKTIAELQKYSRTYSKIDVGILANIENVNLKELMLQMKEKDFYGVRKWIAENLDNDPQNIIRILFESLEKYLEKSTIPAAIIILANYSYKSNFVADHELNLTAMMIELMSECLWT